MEGSRILIVSAYTLFVEAITHILQDQGLEVVAATGDLPTALALIRQHSPNTIILSGDEYPTPDPGLIALLAGRAEDCQVIFFAMESNRLDIHQRRQIGNATPADLVSICTGSPGTRDPSPPDRRFNHINNGG